MLMFNYFQVAPLWKLSIRSIELYLENLHQTPPCRLVGQPSLVFVDVCGVGELLRFLEIISPGSGLPCVLRSTKKMQSERCQVSKVRTDFSAQNEFFLLLAKTQRLACEKCLLLRQASDKDDQAMTKQRQGWRRTKEANRKNSLEYGAGTCLFFSRALLKFQPGVITVG